MEVERKWLVTGGVPSELRTAPADAIDQGYLVVGEDGAEVRLRRRAGGCSLTVKSGRGLERSETEITLSAKQFEALWPASAGRRVQKTRRVTEVGEGLSAEFDEYGGCLDGLRVVEVEFPAREAAGRFIAPDWFGREVTGEAAYSNQRLATAAAPPSEPDA